MIEDNVLNLKIDLDKMAYESMESLIEDIGISSLSNINLSKFVNEDWFEEYEKESHESYVDDIDSESSSDDDLYLNRLHEEMCDASIGIDNLEDYLTPEPEEPEEPKREEYLSDTGYNQGVSDYKEWYAEWEKEHEEWEETVENEKEKLSEEIENNKDKLVEYMMSDDSVQWFIDDFGEEEFNSIVEKNNLYDKDALVQELVDIDDVDEIAYNSYPEYLVMSQVLEDDVLSLEHTIDCMDGTCDVNGFYPINFCKSVEALEKFLDKGFDINSPDDYNLNALHIAGIFDNVDVAVKLLESGIDIELEDDEARTPFDRMNNDMIRDILSDYSEKLKLAHGDSLQDQEKYDLLKILKNCQPKYETLASYYKNERNGNNIEPE